ncbi:MAG: Spi family protease inhibitor [Prevotellaceae bacterium]|jgi:hypothetical protein|nr:Spi family protease inhibitor [Prevotellaceae bacterium]
MKQKYLIITAIVALLFLGCNNTDILNDGISIDKENQFLLNEKEMIQIAGEVEFSGNTRLKSIPVSKKLFNYKLIKEGGNPCYCILNYEGGGFILLSADKRSEPVLAYSYESSFPLNETDMPIGLQEWTESAIEQIKELRNQAWVDDYVSERWDRAIKDGVPSILPAPISDDPPNEIGQ